LAFVFDDYIFYHIPKTGGSYIRRQLQNLVGVQFSEIGHVHCAPIDIFGKAPGKKSFCTVRHPVTWYESYYRYRMDNGWKPAHHIDACCQGHSFEQFVNQFLHLYRFGYVTSLYSRYVPFVDRVLKMENLTDEVKGLLKDWGYNTDNISSGKINATSHAMDTSLSHKTRNRLISIELGVIDYLGYQPDV